MSVVPAFSQDDCNVEAPVNFTVAPMICVQPPVAFELPANEIAEAGV
jgi:hypothetical protein